MNMLSPYGLETPLAPPGQGGMNGSLNGVPAGMQVEQVPFQWLPTVLAFVRRRLRLVLFCTVVTTALGAAYLSQAPVTFTAFTSLLYDSRRADAFLQSQSALDAQALNAQIESQVEILRSEGLARRVVAQLNLAGTQTDIPSGQALISRPPAPIYRWLGIKPKPAPVVDDATRVTQATDTLMRMTAVRRVGLTYVIELNVAASAPEYAQRLANAIAQAYVADQLRAKSAATQQATNWLRARIAELNTQALEADKAVQAYKSANNIVTSEDAPINERQLTILGARQATLHADTMAAKAALDRARLMRASGGADGDVVGQGLQSTVLVSLRQRMIDTQRQYAEWSARYGAQHQAVLRLAEDIAELQRGINSELDRIVGTATNSYEIAQANETAVQTQMDAMIDHTSKVNSDRVELRALQSQADTYRALYTNFLQRYSQAAQDQSFPVSEVQIVSTASAPLQKSGPKGTLILGASTVAGLGIGLALGFLRELTGQEARRRRHPRSARGLECLGTLPLLDPPPSRLWSAIARIGTLFGARRPDAFALPRSGPRGLLRLAADRPDSLFGRAVAELRQQVLERLGTAREGRIIGCLARSAGEGTSTTAANLAYVMAANGHRTVLVDMSHGSHTLTEILGLQPRTETGEDGATTIEAKPHQDRATGLVFRPSALVRTAEMDDGTPRFDLAGAVGGAGSQGGLIVQGLRRNYDVIIIDLPCVESPSLSHSVIAQVDDLLMVARWTPQDEAEMLEAPDMTAASAVRCLGVVLTMVPPRLCDMV